MYISPVPEPTFLPPSLSRSISSKSSALLASRTFPSKKSLKSPLKVLQVRREPLLDRVGLELPHRALEHTVGRRRVDLHQLRHLRHRARHVLVSESITQLEALPLLLAQKALHVVREVVGVHHRQLHVRAVGASVDGLVELHRVVALLDLGPVRAVHALLDLLEGHLERGGDLLAARLDHVALLDHARAPVLIDTVFERQHLLRHHHAAAAAVLPHAPRNGRTDPDGRIRAEPEALRRVELLRRAYEADDALLHEVRRTHVEVAALRHFVQGDLHQPQVRRDEGRARAQSVGEDLAVFLGAVELRVRRHLLERRRAVELMAERLFETARARHAQRPLDQAREGNLLVRCDPVDVVDLV
mmetsp:Transcript_22232/g.56762  ORF Transcript_22232/g.56762 Transcript_22232/m.56762 type:complete len:358 (-) Transcript_22232:823-1896(-)